MTIDSNTQPIAKQPPKIVHTIRSVKLSDIEGLRQHCWKHRSQTRCEDYLQRVLKDAQGQRGLGVVVEHENTQNIIGYGQIFKLSRCIEISDLVVAQAYRSQGIGTAIIQYLIHTMLPSSLPIEIGVAKKNHRALALYKRLGFRESYELELNLGRGKERVIYLRLS